LGHYKTFDVGGNWRPPPSAMAAATLVGQTARAKPLKLLRSTMLPAFGTVFALFRAMSQARPIRPGATYLITRRTERRHCLLRPDPLMNALILYAFIVLAEHYGIMLHAFCAMSTHLHYVITDPLGNLPLFLAGFHRLVALGVKIIRNWDGAVWDRSQTSVVELCTRQAIVEKIAYTLANPVAAGLVWHAAEWPGAKTVVNDIDTNAIDAQRPDQCFSRRNPKWVATASLPISLPPSVPSADAKTFRNDIETELAKLETAAHAVIPINDVLGAKRATEIAPESRITSYETTRQTNPTFAVGRENAEVLKKAIQKAHDFRSAYRRAIAAWRAGDRAVEFPAGTYAMRVFHRANVALE
jgi:putative transposase